MNVIKAIPLGGGILGPGSATDNAVARFNGTTGALIQNSGVTIDDSNILTAAGLVSTGSPAVLIPSTSTYAFARTGDTDTGLYFNVTATRYEFHRDGVIKVSLDAGNNYNFFASTILIGSSSLPNDLTRGLILANGVAPSSDISTQFTMYSANVAAGNAAPHFRTGNGTIIKLYQQEHIADAETSHAVANLAQANAALDALGVIINTILARRENQGFEATS